MLPPALPLLDVAHVEFMARWISVNVASRDAVHRPAAALACACRVAPDRRTLTVFLNTSGAGRVVENLRSNGFIAVTVAQPSSHRALQIKGTDAHDVALQPDDLAFIGAFRASFVEDLGRLQYSPEFARAIVPAPDETLVALAFTPILIFDQSPGHNAGQPLP